MVHDQDAALIERYLTHVRVEKRLASRTVVLYTIDLVKLVEFANQGELMLTQVQNHHVRRWVAQMHAHGRSGRGIALILSGWRGFYAWLGRTGLVGSNPVQDVRAPKGEVKPDARQYIATSHEGLRVAVTSVGDQKEGWVRMQVDTTAEASDAAKKEAADLAPKMHGFEFKLSQNDIDQMSWTLQDITTEPKS